MPEQLELDELLKLAVDALYLSIVIDEQGKIRYVGRNYAEILNIRSEDVIGIPVEQIIPNTRLNHVLKTGQPELGQLFIMNNGDYTICNRFPIRDQEGCIRGVLSTATFQDLDKIQSLNDELKRLKRENKNYKRQLQALHDSTFSLDSIIGQSPEIIKLKNTIEKIAASNLAVLITGETGTGKEVFANAIHQLSGRQFGNYVKINCSAIPKELLESELFGYSEGAFSGAAKGGRTGKMEYADKGTILLDEVGEMSISLQSKLLRVLQEKELERIGSNKTVKLDVRVICSTNQNLEQMVREGTFRQDLFYRINVIELYVPPLRDRKSDIPALCEHFIEKMNLIHGCFISGIHDTIMNLFMEYQWPGNIRELEHVIERACVMTLIGPLTIDSFDFFLPRIQQDMVLAQNPPDLLPNSLSEQKNSFEKNTMIQAIKECGGNKTKAAKLLQMSRSHFYEKLKRYEIL